MHLWSFASPLLLLAAALPVEAQTRTVTRTVTRTATRTATRTVTRTSTTASTRTVTSISISTRTRTRTVTPRPVTVTSVSTSTAISTQLVTLPAVTSTVTPAPMILTVTTPGPVVTLTSSAGSCLPATTNVSSPTTLGTITTSVDANNTLTTSATASTVTPNPNVSCNDAGDLFQLYAISTDSSQFNGRLIGLVESANPPGSQFGLWVAADGGATNFFLDSGGFLKMADSPRYSACVLWHEDFSPILFQSSCGNDDMVPVKCSIRNGGGVDCSGTGTGAQLRVLQIDWRGPSPGLGISVDPNNDPLQLSIVGGCILPASTATPTVASTSTSTITSDSVTGTDSPSAPVATLIDDSDDSSPPLGTLIEGTITSDSVTGTDRPSAPVATQIDEPTGTTAAPRTTTDANGITWTNPCPREGFGDPDFTLGVPVASYLNWRVATTQDLHGDAVPDPVSEDGTAFSYNFTRQGKDTGQINAFIYVCEGAAYTLRFNARQPERASGQCQLAVSLAGRIPLYWTDIPISATEWTEFGPFDVEYVYPPQYDDFGTMTGVAVDVSCPGVNEVRLDSFRFERV